MADGFKKQTLILKNRIAYQNFLGQGQGQGQGQGIEVMQDVYSRKSILKQVCEKNLVFGMFDC